MDNLRRVRAHTYNDVRIPTVLVKITASWNVTIYHG